MPWDRAIWTCRIGYANRDRLPDGADTPLRGAVIRAFHDVTGHDHHIMDSGFGDDGIPLGYATTHQLIHEIVARIETGAMGVETMPITAMRKACRDVLLYVDDGVLAYRTVDSH
jgi:hypothetical protein